VLQPRARAKGTMANSVFWRKLSDEFLKLQGERFKDDSIYSEFGKLMLSGATKIATADGPDLRGWRKALEKGGFPILFVWYKALEKDGLTIELPDPKIEVMPGSAERSLLMGNIDGWCEISAAFCRNREAEAVQAEEKQRSLTRWTPRDLNSANRKVADPVTNPLMTPGEAMAYLGLSKSVVYEHPGLERKSTGTRAVRFATASVLAVKNSPPE
jgi:hypothetical protein